MFADLLDNLAPTDPFACGWGNRERRRNSQLLCCRRSRNHHGLAAGQPDDVDANRQRFRATGPDQFNANGLARAIGNRIARCIVEIIQPTVAANVASIVLRDIGGNHQRAELQLDVDVDPLTRVRKISEPSCGRTTLCRTAYRTERCRARALIGNGHLLQRSAQIG